MMWAAGLSEHTCMVSQNLMDQLINILKFTIFLAYIAFSTNPMLAILALEKSAFELLLVAVKNRH